MKNLKGNPMGEKYGDAKGLSSEVVSALIIGHELRVANLIAIATHLDKLGQVGHKYWEEIAELTDHGEKKND